MSSEVSFTRGLLLGNTPREKLIGFSERIERRSQTHDKDQLCTPLTRFRSAVNPTFRPVHQIFLVNTYLFLEN